MVERKGLKDFLKDDPSLTKKISYEEYKNKKSTPNNSDEKLEKAYKDYKRIVKAL